MHMDEVMADVNRPGKGLERAPYEVEGETRGMSEIQRERNRYYGVGMLNSPDPEGRTLFWEMVNSVYPLLSLALFLYRGSFPRRRREETKNMEMTLSSHFIYSIDIYSLTSVSCTNGPWELSVNCLGFACTSIFSTLQDLDQGPHLADKKIEG